MKPIVRWIFSPLLCALALASPAFAQGWPDRPVRMVVGFGPGSGADTVARIVADKLSVQLKQTVLVENREGAGGAVGTTAVAKAAPDGYTLLLAASPMTISPYMQANPAYDPIRDFVHIMKVAELPSLMVASPDAPYKSLKEMVAYARLNPGKLSYANSGLGSSSHLNVELIRLGTGINVVPVPYKNNGQAMTDTLAGTVGFYFPALPTAIPLVRGGKARGLAIGALRRSPRLPEVPTIAEELGIKGLELITWYGLMAPAGTPPSVISRLGTEMARVMEMPEVRDKLAATGVDVSVMPPEEFTALVRSESARNAKLVKDLGLKE